MELLSPTSRWYPFVSVDSEKLSGEPCFRGTRVPVRVLFECLKDGLSLTEFLEEFEGVPRESATAVLELLGTDLAEELRKDTRKGSRAA